MGRKQTYKSISLSFTENRNGAGINQNMIYASNRHKSIAVLKS